MVNEYYKGDYKMMSTVKDSGDRREFGTGAVRDMQEGKGRCDLLPAAALLRLARHFEAGAKKYGDNNWQKGIPISSFIDSGMRHLLKYLDGWMDEDHLTAAVWNLTCAMWTEEKYPELQDLPTRKATDVDIPTRMQAMDYTGTDDFLRGLRAKNGVVDESHE